MKNFILKNLVLIGFLAPASHVLASETNWGQIIRDMKSIKTEIVKLNQGAVSFEVARLPNRELRFIGFKNYAVAQQAEVILQSKGKELEELCKESLIFKKPFAAELIIKVAPIADEFDFNLSDGQKRNTRDLQNPFKSEGSRAMLVEGSKFSWTYGHGEFVRYEGSPEAELISMIDKALQNDTQEMVRIDLSQHNGLACDLASENVQLSFERTVIHEKGLPETNFWLDQYKFAELFRSFWSDRNEISPKLSEDDLKASELILLGWNLSERNIEKSELLKSATRLGNLLTGLKHEKSGVKDADKPRVETSKVKDHWRKTAEYIAPSEKVKKQNLVTSFRALKVTLER